MAGARSLSGVSGTSRAAKYPSSSATTVCSTAPKRASSRGLRRSAQVRPGWRLERADERGDADVYPLLRKPYRREQLAEAVLQALGAGA